MEKKTKYRLSGVVAGLTNGIFGGGGGIPLLVLLTKWAGVGEKKAFATCVAVIFPMCAVSAALWYWRAELSLTAALPYLLGGFAGGLVGGNLSELFAIPAREKIGRAKGVPADQYKDAYANLLVEMEEQIAAIAEKGEKEE